LIDRKIAEAVNDLVDMLGEETGKVFAEVRAEIRDLKKKWIALESAHAVRAEGSVARIELLLADLERKLGTVPASVVPMHRHN
jgi:hypothetical protein